MPYYYYYQLTDWTYILAIAAMVLSLLASVRVKTTFARYSRERPQSGMTGFDAARAVLDANGLHHVGVERVSGNLTDHYDPRTKTIRLSESVYGVSSTAAVGVAAHEAGHTVQHAKGYVPLQLRNAIIPITNIGSRLSMPLFLVGLLLAYFSSRLIVVAYAGVLCFGLCVVFQLLTLPTEFNASRRAVGVIESCGLLTESEVGSAKKVLRAAALTYLAALAVALTQFLRLLMIAQRRGRR